MPLMIYSFLVHQIWAISLTVFASFNDDATDDCTLCFHLFLLPLPLCIRFHFYLHCQGYNDIYIIFNHKDFNCIWRSHYKYTRESILFVLWRFFSMQLFFFMFVVIFSCLFMFKNWGLVEFKGETSLSFSLVIVSVGNFPTRYFQWVENITLNLLM